MFCRRDTHIPVFLIRLYGTSLAQRASYLALHSSLFGPDGAASYDYIVTNSINSLLMAQDVFSMVHILYLVEPIWPMLDTYLGIIHRELEESIW